MSHGGKRTGAGRPKGTNAYHESTQPLRIPISRVEEVRALISGTGRAYALPLYGSTVQAGFPSPADDYIECQLDLNEHLIHHPAATFFVRASGNSMINAGIHPGDLLIVDRSLEAAHDKIIIAALNGELTVKRLYRKGGQVKLLPENTSYKAIDITDNQDMVIWGVVTHVIHEAT